MAIADLAFARAAAPTATEFPNGFVVIFIMPSPSKQYQWHSQKHSMAPHRSPHRIATHHRRKQLTTELDSPFHSPHGVVKEFFCHFSYEKGTENGFQRVFCEIERRGGSKIRFGCHPAENLPIGALLSPARSKKIPTTIPQHPCPRPPLPTTRKLFWPRLAQLSCNSENSGFFSHCMD